MNMNGYGVPELPQSQYYQPPLLPSSSTSSSQNAPTWFIVAVAVAAVIFCYLLYVFLRRRERKANQCHDGSSSETEEVEEEMPRVPKAHAPKSLQTEAILRDVRAVTWPNDCPTCRHQGGLYHFKYKCSGCRFKNDWGIHVQFPSGK